MTPIGIPAARAADWTEASCSSKSHCSQEWKPTRSASRWRSAATAAEAGSRSGAGHERQSAPWISARALQVAKSVSASPSRSRYAV
jgi:hypothetical protein